MPATKVLLLHGYSQNAAIFSKRLRSLQKACGDEVEFVFLDGTFKLPLQDVSTFFEDNKSLLPAPEAETPNPRSWFRRKDSNPDAQVDLMNTLVAMRDILHEAVPPFDGVFGFSQGAALAGLLSALLERPHSIPQFLADGKPPHPPFKFCVAACGGRVPGGKANEIYGSSFSTPTLHLIGIKDSVVGEALSMDLAKLTVNGRVEKHDGGHWIPFKPEWRAFIASFLRNPLPLHTTPSPNSPTTARHGQRLSGERTIKVLMLHGFTQNSHRLSKETQWLREVCGAAVEFVYVDAPLILSDQEVDDFHKTNPTASRGTGAPGIGSLKSRAWSRWNKEERRSIGLVESLLYLRDLLHTADPPFDGVFGFSQGAAMAGLLSALLEKPYALPTFMVNGKTPHPAFKFCIAVSGFRFTDPLARTIFGEGYYTPTLHVLGREDQIITPGNSKTLIKLSRTQRIEFHNGAHWIPSESNWPSLFKETITRSNPLQGTGPSPELIAPRDTPSKSRL